MSHDNNYINNIFNNVMSQINFGAVDLDHLRFICICLVSTSINYDIIYKYTRKKKIIYLNKIKLMVWKWILHSYSLKCHRWEIKRSHHIIKWHVMKRVIKVLLISDQHDGGGAASFLPDDRVFRKTQCDTINKYLIKIKDMYKHLHT